MSQTNHLPYEKEGEYHLLLTGEAIYASMAWLIKTFKTYFETTQSDRSSQVFATGERSL